MTNIEKALIARVEELEQEVARLTAANHEMAKCLEHVFDNLVVMIKLEMQQEEK